MGNVLSFDRVNDTINCGNNNNLSIQNALTIGVWIKLTNNSLMGQSPIAKYESTKSYKIVINSGTLTGIVYNGSSSDISVATEFLNNKWYFITYTFTQESERLYKNGLLLKDECPTISSIATSTASLVIGRDRWGTEYYFNGSIKDIKIYDATLSANQIKQNYIAGLDSLLSNENISKEDYNQRVNALAYEK